MMSEREVTRTDIRSCLAANGYTECLQENGCIDFDSHLYDLANDLLRTYKSVLNPKYDSNPARYYHQSSPNPNRPRGKVR